MNKKPKLIHSIKGKLISATCMLLVAMIMVVSSTYAWFTLSTAPEVKGITTAVGANGALEMLLLTKDATGNWSWTTPANVDWTNGEGSAVEKNTYWGNLVDLSSVSDYGLDKITLYPSQLNAMEGTALSEKVGSVIQDAPLMTPVYGADGRMTDLAKNTQFGAFDKSSGNFFPKAGNEIVYGVRAVGTSSGLTPRQMAYSNAVSAAATAGGQAKNVAAYSLNNEGAALADIAIKHGTAASGTDKYTVAEINDLLDIINGLLGTEEGVDGALEYIEYAYMQYLLAFSASKHVDSLANAEELHSVVAGFVNADGATLASVIGELENLGATLPAAMHNDEGTGYMDKLIATITEVKTAKGELEALIPEVEPEKAEFTWEQIRPSLGRLCDTEALTVNGFKVADIKANTSAFANNVLLNGIQITMTSGAGVYADIADHCGDYSAVITIKKIEYGSTVLENASAKMQTATKVLPDQYISLTNNAVTTITTTDGKTSARPDSSNAVAMPISEFYGYVIDLAFRTNAAESNLLLQTEAVDRIYDSNNNSATMGGGSSMTFASASTDFGNDKVTALMSNIRIVFFDTDSKVIIAKAGLDTENASIGADGVTANMYILSETAVYEVTTTTAEGDEVVVCTMDENGKYFRRDDSTVEVTPKDGTTPVKTNFLKGSDAVIASLTQNQPKNVSVLVYLDGTTITNADVAATAAQSMTGKMNLQFSSSANLVPMEYADLHIQEQ